MPLHTSDLDEFWACIAAEFSQRLDDVRPKLGVKARLRMIHDAKARMKMAAPYLDDMRELKCHALQPLERVHYVRGSQFKPATEG